MIRTIIAVVLGSAVAFGLLFMMQALIATGHSAITNVERAQIVDFVRVQREETVERKRDKPSRPSSPDEAPPESPEPSMRSAAGQGDSKQAVQAVEETSVPVPQVEMSISPGMDISGGTADGDYLPIVKVAPVYPRRAIELGIEGYVIVEFTVTKSGSVRDVQVVEYDPSTIFNKAAIAAAEKFKYKPRVVNGQPIEVRGVLHKITFELED